MQCLGRIAKVDGILHFADGRQRFYLPYRCTNMCLPDSNCCSRCTGRTADKIQSSGKFDHGLCNGPIPDHSHMYGGAWYNAKYAKLSLTPDIRRQTDDHYAAYMETIPAVEDPVGEDPITEDPIAEDPITEEEPVLQNVIVKPRQKSKPIQIEEDPVVKPSTSSKRKPSTAKPSTAKPSTAKPSTAKAVLAKPSTAKPSTAKPIEAPIQINATHIEQDTEEIFADDYEIEYIKLSPFELNGTMYLREPNKNKLFQKPSKGVGDYIGRYDPYTETIRTDIPDSDED